MRLGINSVRKFEVRVLLHPKTVTKYRVNVRIRV